MTRTDRIMDLTEQWAAQRLAEAGAVELLGDGVALVRDDRDGISHAVVGAGCGCGEYRCRQLRAARIVESASFAVAA